MTSQFPETCSHAQNDHSSLVYASALLLLRRLNNKPCFPAVRPRSSSGTVLILGETIYAHRRGPINYLSPQRIICSKCGDLLYTGLELETPSEIIQRNGGGRAPACKKTRVSTESPEKRPPTKTHPQKTPPFIQKHCQKATRETP